MLPGLEPTGILSGVLKALAVVPPRVSPGNVGGGFWLSPLGEGLCYWPLVGGSQGCRPASYSAQGSPPWQIITQPQRPSADIEKP